MPTGVNTSEDQQRLRELAERLRVPNMDLELLQQALSHASWVREQGRPELRSNQRLEFLGDAVLELCLAEHLYKKLPDVPEGYLTRMKAVVARSTTLARIARQAGIGEFLLLGRGEEESGGRAKPSLLGDAMEAIIGAVYVAKGVRSARALVHRLFAEVLAGLDDHAYSFDHKTALQELLQRHTKQTPRYVTVGTKGPPHQRIFEVEVRFRQTPIGSGSGRSKQDAQQEAAGAALANRDAWLPAICGADAQAVG